MKLLYAMQIIGGCIMAAGYIPQVHQILKTKQVRDLNIRTFISLSFGLTMMEAYAIGLVAHDRTTSAFLITNSLGLGLNTAVVLLIAFYRRRVPSVVELPAEEQA
jgi:MtN3 and saliva related transmembrane protein